MEWNLEKVTECVKKGKYYHATNEEFKKYLKEVSQKDILEGISNLNNVIEVTGFYNEIMKNNIEINHELALALATKCGLFYKTFSNIFTEEDKVKISEEYFSKLKKDEHLMYCLPSELDISNENWEYLIETNNFYKHLKNRENIPDFVKEYLITKSSYSLKYWDEYIGEIDAKYLILYLNTFKNDIDEQLINENVDCDELDIVIKECPWVFKYFKKPSIDIVNIAIEADPENIQYVKRPSDKLKIKALSLDKTTVKYIEKTKAVCKYLGIKEEEATPLYPNEYYFCKFDEDLCDESNIIKTCIVKGKDMEDFMSQTFTKSFGNLDDYNEINVKDVVLIKPISKEEIDVLKKFGVDDLESGYFSFSDE